MAIGDPTIHNTLGVFLDIILISAALYGAGCLQGWLYFRNNCRGDPWAVKGIVLLVLVCDTAQMILLSIMLYEYLITHFGEPLMGKMERLIVIESFFAGIIAFAVQHFYCWRILLLTESYLISGFISLLSIASLVCVFAFSIIASGFKTLDDFLRLTTLGTLLNVFGALTDVLITGTIIFMLRRHSTPFKRTSDMINRLIFFTFHSGLPTSVCAVLVIIMLNVIPKTFVYLALYFLLGRFYTNSLLVTLNSREYIRYGTQGEFGGMGCSGGISVPSIIVPSADRGHPNDANSPGNAISIRMDESSDMTHQHDDGKFGKHPRYAMTH